jgi:hypothetical protein
MVNNMKSFLGNIFIVLMVIGIIACKQKKTDNTSTLELKKYSGTDKLVPMNFMDTNYVDFLDYAKDTLTPNGWTIKYLVKDDNTKYNDIYIECRKGNLQGIFQGKDILQFRSYFVPKFVGETKSFLFFTHACATDCSALLVMSKDSLPTFTDYQRVYDYNIKLGQILFVPDECYANEDKKFILTLADIQKKKEYNITFDNICSAVNKGSCIDTVIFSNNKVTIKTTLRASIKSEKFIVQTKTIVF